ncbi:MAG: hypothetical protein OEZ39_14775 [Gammaproteobacteria bacterium]|nr:hypothetical protein [Gammaproteobacteria bacterium]
MDDLLPVNPSSDYVVLDKVSELLIQGRFKLYPISEADRTTHPPARRTIETKEKTQYLFTPASTLLISEPEEVKTFTNPAEAKSFIQSLGSDEAQLQTIVEELGLPKQSGKPDSDKLANVLSQHLATGKVVVIVSKPSGGPRPEKQEKIEHSQVGNRSVDLGPHGGLHNQNWDGVEANPEKFKTVRQVDMDNLSKEDATARSVFKRQGRNEEQIEQVLSSGNDFTAKELKQGDKIYGFDSQSNKYGAKKQDSMYWLDESGYQDVKSKYYKNGQWDKEGVKNHLALPCMNRADVIDVAEVTAPQTAMESTVGVAREQIAYTKGDYSTGMMGKIMPGGGKQITPDPSKTSAVTRLTGTP